MRPVGYYVHHQGAGHWQRACAVASRLGRPCTLIGTFTTEQAERAPAPILDLPDDRSDGSFAGADREAERPLAVHYAPLDHPGARARMAAIARWAADTDPALLVVDVSVEVTLLARLLSVPTLVVRLAGNRTDPAHLEAFRSAEAVLAPFPATLEPSETPDWVRAKTLYAGLVAADALPPPPVARDDGHVVVILGRGGERRPLTDIVAAAVAVPGRSWHVLGEVESPPDAALPANLHLHGWVADPADHVRRAAIVVGAAGDGVVGLAAACAKRFVCLPEPRLYDEQVVKARALAECGAAILRETWPADWPTLVAQAERLDPAIIAGLARPDAIGWIAQQIEAMAGRRDARRSEGPVVR